MKIAQVISTPPFAWARGGPARNVYGLSKALAKRGHEVAILSTDLYEPKKRQPRGKNPTYIDGIQVFRFRYFSDWLAWKHGILISPGLIVHLRNHLVEYDVVHLQELLSVHAIATATHCQKCGVPYVLSARGSVPRLKEKKGLAWFFDNIGGSRSLRYASKIMALTKIEAEQFQSMDISEDKIEIIPNAIDLSEFEKLPQRGTFRRKHNLDGKDKLVLYLGRIHKIKGIDLLAKAFAELSRNVDGARLVIAGPDDGYLSTLKVMVRELKIEEKVLFTGPLYERDKMEAYVDADVYVLPSTYEVFGITILEAWACGTPVITTDRCGIAGFVDKVGYVVEHNREQLRDVIVKALSDEELRKKLGDEGRKLVMEEFTWDAIVERVENLYEDAKNRGRRNVRA